MIDKKALDRAEIIAALRHCAEREESCTTGYEGCPYSGSIISCITDLLSDAAALLERDAEPNDPLTLEELMEMDREPVWAVLTPSRSWELKGACWMIVKWDYVDRLAHSPIGDMFANDYGKAWLAYRRKPEGGGE